MSPYASFYLIAGTSAPNENDLRDARLENLERISGFQQRKTTRRMRDLVIHKARENITAVNQHVKVCVARNEGRGGWGGWALLAASIVEGKKDLCGCISYTHTVHSDTSSCPLAQTCSVFRLSSGLLCLLSNLPTACKKELYLKKPSWDCTSHTMLLSRLLDILYSAIPSKYYLYILVAILILAIIHAFAQGRRTDRERDLHARVILVTVRKTCSLNH